MKLRSFYMIVSILSISLVSLTSCSSEDKDNTEQTIPKNDVIHSMIGNTYRCSSISYHMKFVSCGKEEYVERLNNYAYSVILHSVVEGAYSNTYEFWYIPEDMRLYSSGINNYITIIDKDTFEWTAMDVWRRIK